MTCRTARTEHAIVRGPTRLTSLSHERAALLAELRAECLERFGNDEPWTLISLAMDWLWQAKRAASPGFARMDPVVPVRAPKVQRPVVDDIPEVL